MRSKESIALWVVLLLMVGLFAFAPRTSASQPLTPLQFETGETPPNCQLASLVAVVPAPLTTSPVASQTTAICHANPMLSPLPMEDLTSKLPTTTSVCGGEPGQAVGSTLVLDGQLANLSALGATFDQDGCADLTDVFDQATQPLAPTALQLVEVSTTGRLGWLSTGRLLSLFTLFLVVTGGWIVMLNSHRPERDR